MHASRHWPDPLRFPETQAPAPGSAESMVHRQVTEAGSWVSFIPFMCSVIKESVLAGAIAHQFGPPGLPLVWLRPLQTGYSRQTAGHLSCLLQFCESGKEQANPSYAAGVGQDNGQRHCLSSGAKLTAIIHGVCSRRHVPQKKYCRIGLSSTFSEGFNTVSDRLAIAGSAVTNGVKGANADSETSSSIRRSREVRNQEAKRRGAKEPAQPCGQRQNLLIRQVK